jgi:hydrophobe/amphiphile efflux-1 (HAE1) family protein
VASISDPFLRRPVLTIVCSLFILLAGLISLVGLGLEDLPQIAPTRVSVSATFPAASPEVVEQGVTAILEQQLNGIEGVSSISSSSSLGGSSISLLFEEGDPELNAIKVQNEASLATRRLPQAVSRQGIRVRRSSSDLLMILGFSSRETLYSRDFIAGWLDQRLREGLQRLDGVGEVVVFGSSNLAYHLWLDPVALQSRGLTVNDVSLALLEQNVLPALGQLGEEPAPPDQALTLPLQADGRLRTVDELERLVVSRMADGGVVRLADVGRVSLGPETYDSSAINIRGDPTVAVGILQRDGSNALEVSEQVRGGLERLRGSFPPGIEVDVIVDVASTVRANLERTAATLRDAVILVLVVLLLFLGRWRLALIPAIAVPVALVGSLTLVRLSGENLNSLTLFGLVLATGIVVDDAIVVSEDIAARIERGAAPLPAAFAAMEELAGAVIATSLVLAAVFLPVLLIPGSIGRLYQPIALAISGAILFSTINALSFTPMACSRVLGGPPRRLPVPIRQLSAGLRELLGRGQRAYGRLLGRLLRWRRRVAALLLAGLVLTALGLSALPTAFIPDEDQGQIRGYFTLPDGASLQRTEAVMETIRDVVAREPTIVSGNFYAGRSFGRSSPNTGSFYLRLPPPEERVEAGQSTADVRRRLQKAIGAAVTEARVVVTTPPTVRGFNSEAGLTMELLDRSGGLLDLEDFERAAREFAREAEASGRFERVSTRFDAASPQLELIADRDLMAALDLPYAASLQEIGSAIGGRYLNDTYQDGRIRRIYVQLEGQDRATPEDLQRLKLRTRSGSFVSASDVVRLQPRQGANRIERYEQTRSIRLTAIPKDNISSGQAIRTLQDLSDRLGGGGSLDLVFTGLAREEQRAGGSSGMLFSLGVLVVYLVLAALYDSFLDPLIILLTVPLAVMGALAGLALRGLPLDVYAQMGMLVLVSLAAKNGILIVEFANQKRSTGMALEEAVHAAAVARMRPIVLTAITSLAGFLPLLLAQGSGSASRISIGTVVFSGLLVATVLTLFVLPSVYLLLKGWRATPPNPMP